MVPSANESVLYELAKIATYRSISNGNQQAMLLACYMPSSRHFSLRDFRSPYHLRYFDLFSFSLLYISNSPFFFPLPLVFLHILLVYWSTSTSDEHFSELSHSTSRGIATEVGRYTAWGGTRLCAIVVSRLLFPGNSTSFTNYPLRAHTIRKWRSLPDIVANAAPIRERVTVPENGDGAGSYLAIV